MQNKGLVRIFTAALTLVCLFYLSFSVVTSIHASKAAEYAESKAEVFNKNGDKSYDQIENYKKLAEYNYLDSVGYEKVWLGYTLSECRERELNLGLDLKGGMNIILEVSIRDVIRALSGYNNSPNFNKALDLATERQKTKSQVAYLDLFVQAYAELDPNASLASIFSTFELKDKISLSSSNEDVIRVLRSEIEDAVSNSFNVLRTRIDRFGVVQPNLQRLGNTGRILIELPGIKEPERVRKLLQGSANLEFWETYEFNEIFNNISEANRLLAERQREESRPEESVATQPEPAVQAEATSSLDSLTAALGASSQTVRSDSSMQAAQAEFAKENPLFALLQPNVQGNQVGRGPVVGYAQGRDTAKVNEYFAMKQVREVLPRDLGLRWTVKPIDEKSDIYQLIAIKVTNRDGRAPLAGNVITDARADFSQHSAFANVSMSMNAEGAKIWARMTKENIGKSIAIALDGFIYSFPTVNSEIPGGQSQITGNFTVNEAKDLANTLKSGKMPAPCYIVQEDVVGPSLGKEAIESGLISFVIAFCLVLLYMMFYYGFIPGLIADLALFTNVFFLMGILASFGAVLTLPGIAGIVLTLGMAVDGNVLIYERIREEMIAGKNMKKAITDGFKKAISAIVDANVTTLLTGIVLIIFGTGPIYGFAVTLVIGIFTSFFSSVFLTRLMLQTYAKRENAKELPFTTRFTEAWFQNTKFDFIGKRRIGYIISAVMILISVVSFVTRGLSLGVDFTGGRNYIVRFDQPVNTEHVRQMLEGAFGDANAQVITFGNDNQVRISTKYKIDYADEAVEMEMEGILYERLKPLLKEGTDMEHFADHYIQSSQKVGPTIADDIKRASVWAVLFSLIIVSLYIFIRFNDFAFSIGTMASLAHDTIILLGIYSLFYSIAPFSMEMDQSFIAALLTYLGYSVNDTVVIFDRIRENIGLYPKRERKSIMNDSLNETLSRTFSTSMSVIVVLVAIFLFGGETIRGFVFALLVGSILGIYSTLFVAVPVSHDIILKKKSKLKAAPATEKK